MAHATLEGAADSIERAAAAGVASHDEDLVLRFFCKRVEPAIGAVFLAKGGTLGSAAERGLTHFHLSGGETSVPVAVTDKLTQVEIKLPPAMYTRQTAADGGALLIPAKLNVNVKCARVAASINGTPVATPSGAGSVSLKELFTEQISRTAAATGDAPEAAGAIVLPFEILAIKYPNSDAHTAVIAFSSPSILARDAEGKHTVPQDIQFVLPPQAHTQTLQRAEGVLEAVYKAGWAVCEAAKFEPCANLTKTIMRTTAGTGYNGSGFALAAKVNDIPPSYPNETLEALLGACVGLELDDEAHRQLLTDLEVPSIAATRRWAQTLASALSAHAAATVPYRIDGTPRVTAKGIEMEAYESWNTDAQLTADEADDCDGSGGRCLAFIAAAQRAEEDHPGAFPHLRALANSLGSHYVAGATVLAANAGHADAADEHATAIAGHFIGLLVPKASFLIGLHRGSLGSVAGEAVVEPEHRAAVETARFNALYPNTLVSRMPMSERAPFASFASLKASPVSNHVLSLQPLALEGTTWGSSALYTHDPAERDERQAWFKLDKSMGNELSPNISRAHKTLDTGLKGEHAFYKSLVEISLSLSHPLFTDEELRAKGHATPHFRFVKATGSNPITEAGVSPSQLATGEFALVPLWRVDADLANVIDVSAAADALDTIPRSSVPLQLDAGQSEQFGKALASLKDLDAKLQGSPTKESMHEAQSLLSIAALLHSADAVENLKTSILAQDGVRGRVHGLDTVIPGLATDSSGKDVARLVTIDLELPMPA